MDGEKLATLAPGRLSDLLCLGSTGHHPLFDRDEIVAAFEAPDAPVEREEADELGEVLLAMCRDPFDVARTAVAGLSHPARHSLIRLYFRLLDRAEQERRSSQ
jgi:hypothetical protein